ncbi:MAG: tetratricopeptide repeat protein [Phycisphaerales bacterium]|nr:MAG: tetratricopeptide repeat protein [Phycisphaerales bacterium]
MPRRVGRSLILVTLILLILVALIGVIGTLILRGPGLAGYASSETSDTSVRYGPFQAADNADDWGLGALATYTRQISENPDQPGPYLSRAKLLMSIGERERAEQDFTAALQRGAEGREIYRDRARCYVTMGRVQAAINDYTRAIELEPDDPLLRRARGELRYQMGEAAGAVEDLTMAADRFPDQVQIRRRLAWSQWMTGDVDAALESFDRMIELGLNDLHAYMSRGAVHLHRRELAEAESDLEQAIRAFDADPSYAYFYLWLTKVRLGEREAADEAVRTHFARTDRMRRSAWTPRIASFLLGDMTEEEFLVEAESGAWQPAAEQMCEAYFYAGSVRLIDGDAETARAYFQRSVDTNTYLFYEYCSAQSELKRLEDG